MSIEVDLDLPTFAFVNKLLQILNEDETFGQILLKLVNNIGRQRLLQYIQIAAVDKRENTFGGRVIKVIFIIKKLRSEQDKVADLQGKHDCCREVGSIQAKTKEARANFQSYDATAGYGR